MRQLLIITKSTELKITGRTKSEITQDENGENVRSNICKRL